MMGVKFEQLIFSGIKNQNSKIGVYAGSRSSYKTFNKLFDKIIEEYHGHKPGVKHVSNMSTEGLNGAIFTSSDAAMVKSTRIRVCRNLQGHALGPGITKIQREGIMYKIKHACE